MKKVKQSAKQLAAVRGSAHPKSKFTDKQIKKIRADLAKGIENKAEYARNLGCSVTALRRIEQGVSYADVV